MKCPHDRVVRTCSACSPDTVYEQYKYKAAERGLSFTLTPEQFRKLVSGRCHYCGTWAGGRVLGIDRRDNRQGYTFQNCVGCCGPHNFMKGQMSEFEFLAEVRLIADYQEQLRRKKLEEKQNGRNVESGSGTKTEAEVHEKAAA